MKKIYTLISLVFCILLSSNLYSQVIITDTIYIDNDATVNLKFYDTNYGSIETFSSYIGSGSNPIRERSFMQFDISCILAGASLISANLMLSGINHTGKNESVLQIVKESWEEYQITYKNQPSVGDEKVILPQSNTPDEDYIVDIKSFIQLWINGAFSNNGFVLRFSDGELGEGDGLSFASSDYLNQSKHPYIVIQYTIPEIPKTSLIASDCGLTEMELDESLVATPVTGAKKYGFHVENISTGDTIFVVNDTNALSLNNIGIPTNLGDTIDIKVKVKIGDTWGNYGLVCHNMVKSIETLNPCVPKILTFTIPNPIPVQSFTLRIDLPANVTAGSHASITNSTTATVSMVSGGQIPIYEFTNLSGGEIFEYEVIVGCDYLHDINTITVTNIYTDITNGMQLTPLDFQIQSAVLNFKENLSQNISNNNAYINSAFTRTFVYQNTGSAPFTGAFEFYDETEYPQGQNGVEISAVSYNITQGTGPGNVTHSSNIIYSDIDAKVELEIQNLAPGGTIEIVEIVTLIACPITGIDNSRTNFEANYGCEDINLCKRIWEQTHVTKTLREDKPEIKYELLTEGYPDCWATPHERIIKITNVGDYEAESVEFVFLDPNVTAPKVEISKIDNNSIEVFKLVLGVEQAVSCTNSNAPYPPYGTAAERRITNSPLPVGESVYVRYNEIITCPFGVHDDVPVVSYWDGFPIVVMHDPCPSFEDEEKIHFEGIYYGHRIWEHYYSCSQFSNNLTSTLNGGDALTINLGNSSNLYLQSGPGIDNAGQTGFTFDAANARLEVKIETSYGLIVDQNVPVTLVSSSLLPDITGTIESYTSGASGDELIVQFEFPTSFYGLPASSKHGWTTVPTQAYFDFFQSFNVRYGIKALPCAQNPPPFATVCEYLSFIPNVNNPNPSCPEGCKIQLASVCEDIFIHCPGCLYPGWHISNMTAHRLNYGPADTDNNNFPDSYPVGGSSNIAPPNAKEDNIMLGDELEISINAFLPDGDLIQQVNLGFDQSFGQIEVTSELVPDLQFTGATGSYDVGGTGTPIPFTLPASVGQRLGNKWIIDIDVNILNQYASGLNISKFTVHDVINVDMVFLATNNLVSTSGEYYHIENIHTVINISGTDFNPQSPKVDAGNFLTSVDYYNNSFEDRRKMLYWCTAFDRGIRGIGVDFEYADHNVHNYCQNADAGNWQDPCYTTISDEMFTNVGRKDQGENYGHGGDQISWNSFSHELRDLWNLNEINFTFPSEWEVDEIWFQNTQLTTKTTSSGNLIYTDFTDIPLGTHPFTEYQGIMNTSTSGAVTTVSIYPKAVMNQDLYYQGKNGFIYGWDEIKKYRIYVYLKMSDYHQTTSSIPVGNNSFPTTSYWSEFPLNHTIGNNTIVKNFTSGKEFIRPETELIFQQTSLGVNGTYVEWDINIEPLINNITTGSNPTYKMLRNYFETRAENTFLYFPNTPTTVTISSVELTTYGQGNATTPITTTILPQNNGVGTDDLYRLGDIGNHFYNYRNASIHIKANFDCSLLAPNSTVSQEMFIGWNCYAYPDNHAEACWLKSTNLDFQVFEVGLQTELQLPTTIPLCDIVEITVPIQATSVGELHNIMVKLEESNGEYSYISGSSVISGASIPVPLTGDPTQIGNQYVWDFDHLGFSTPIAAGISNRIELKFQVQTSCDFENYTFNGIVSGTNYCDKRIEVPIQNTPDVDPGNLVIDKLEIDVDVNDVSICASSNQVTLTIYNVGTTPTGLNNIVEVVVPSPFSCTAGCSGQSGNVYTVAIPVNIAPGSSYTTSITIDVPQTITNLPQTFCIDATVISRAEYLCMGNTCYFSEISDTDSDCFDVLPAVMPSAFFTFYPCINAGVPVNFYNQSQDATSYLWNVNGQAVTSAVNFDEVLDEYGYYCIELHAINDCGWDMHQEVVYVSQPQCNCSTITADISGEYLITATDYWDINTFGHSPIYVDGTIIITNGVKLTMHNLEVKFSEQSRIIVEQGAELLLRGANLTKYDNCGMWQGVEVWGESGDDSYSPMQGIMIVDERSIIQHAHIGILLGKREMDCICEHNHNGYIDEGDKYDWQKSGGLVQNGSTDNSRFSNNGIDIKYNPKSIRESSNNRLYGIYFEPNTGVNPSLADYNYNTLATNPYPSVYIPWAGKANPKQRTWMGIQMELLEGIEINNCSFKEKEYAIHSINAQYNVFNSTFEELSYGIYALHNFHSVFNRHEIANCFFDQIHDDVTAEGKAIYMLNGFGEYIHDNQLRNNTFPPDYTKANIGIQMDASINYNISENYIEAYSKGVIANWSVSGLIGAKGPIWEGNLFESCILGIETFGFNNFLQLKCNDHSPLSSGMNYQANWENYADYIQIQLPPPIGLITFTLSLGDQGSNGGLNPKRPAGNTFYTPLRKHIKSDAAYHYFHHIGSQYIPNITGTPIVLHQTAASYPNDIISCSPSWSIPVIIGNQSFLTSMNNKKAEAEMHLEDYFKQLEDLDNGETEDLLFTIQNAYPNWYKRNELISHSPLSDTVITTLMREDILYQYNFTLLMMLNLPLSKHLVPEFNAYIAGFSYWQKMILEYIQENNINPNTSAAIYHRYEQAEQEYYYMQNALMQQLLDSGMYVSAIDLLETDGNDASEIAVFGSYMETENYSMAAQKLNTLQQSIYPFSQEYAALQEKVLLLYQSGKTLYDMDSLDYVQVYNLALKCPEDAAVYSARAIVEIISGEHIPSCMRERNTRSMVQGSNSSGEQEQEMLGDNYPDPCKTSTRIPYYIPKGLEGKIQIKTIQGALLYESGVLPQGKGELLVNTEIWSSGVYMYLLYIKDYCFEVKKMVKQ